MACTIHARLPSGSPDSPVLGRAMTRCECTAIPFDEAARRMRAEGLTIDQAVRRSGCGRNCEACLPDLRRHLAAALAAAAPARTA